MGIEERISNLERLMTDCQKHVENLEKKGTEQWVMPQELAATMKCSLNTVYQKIRSGEIYASHQLGKRGIKIPMSQFYEEKDASVHIDLRERKAKRKLSMEEQIFGKIGSM